MAEKYGTVPKRFTAKWWEYVRDYYKWRILVTAFALILIGYTVWQVKTATDYDVMVTLASSHGYGDGEIAAMTDMIRQNSADINGDGEINVGITQLVYTGDLQIDTAYDTKFILSLQDSECLIYLMDKERFDRLVGDGGGDETFTPVSDWSDTDFDDNDCYISGGVKYGVKVASGGEWKKHGFADAGLYLAVRKNYKEPENTAKLYEACKNTADKLMR